jgi:hypothetical protein
MREQDVVDCAARLYPARPPGTAFVVDDEEPSTLSKILLLPFTLIKEARKDNPYAPPFKFARHGRNKLIVFDDWVVRCTYQQYVPEKRAELFYYSGSPLNEITSVSCSSSSVNIGCVGGNLGGSMHTTQHESGRILRKFQDLRAKGKLRADTRVD